MRAKTVIGPMNEANKFIVKPGFNEDEVYRYFGITINYLQKSIYPKLSDDNMYELNKKLKHWFNKNVNEGLNEISEIPFKSAIKKMQYPQTIENPNIKKQIGRSEKLTNTFFRDFIGLGINGKPISGIYTYNGSGHNDDEITLHVYLKWIDEEGLPTHANFYYDLIKDTWETPNNIDLSRKDAQILRKIAMKLNPTTRYKNGIQDLEISDY